MITRLSLAIITISLVGIVLSAPASPQATKPEKAMNDKNFTTAFSVDQTPEEAFKAIQNVRGWWSEEIEGGTSKLNDEFTYHYKDIHRSKIRLKEVVAGKKMVWLVLDNYFNFVGDKTEWKGNEMIFEVSKKGGKTEVRFTQVGLSPEYECYDICSNAWGTYINGSLKSLITTGKGQPNRADTDHLGHQVESSKAVNP